MIYVSLLVTTSLAAGSRLDRTSQHKLLSLLGPLLGGSAGATGVSSCWGGPGGHCVVLRGHGSRGVLATMVYPMATPNRHQNLKKQVWLKIRYI